MNVHEKKYVNSFRYIILRYFPDFVTFIINKCLLKRFYWNRFYMFKESQNGLLKCSDYTVNDISHVLFFSE